MNKSIWENMDEIEDDIDDLDDPDFVDVTEADEKFAKELFDFLQGIIEEEDKVSLTEEFMSDRGATEHFHRHCLGRNSSTRTSTRQTVYYDFRDVSQYKEYERILNVGSRDSSGSNIQGFVSLLDRESIEKWFRKLFEGNKYIIFTSECGFHNSHGRISILIHAFASDVTRNYQAGNTIDIMIRATNGRTITLYAVDANYFENKINSIIRRYHDDDIEPFSINH